MSITATTEVQFEPPGPGCWELDPVHFPRPVTPYWAEMHPEPFGRGFAEVAAFYGLLFETRAMTYVNGFAYGQVRPLAPEEIPARLARAEEVVAKKLWREQVREWEETSKPRAIVAHLELQAVDPDALTDNELVGYLGRCRDHHARMIYQHMRYTGTAVIPPGDLLVHVGEWTGLPPSQLLGMMRGASPVSAGASAQLDRMIAALRTDGAARKRLESADEPSRIIDALRSGDGETAAALSAYLDFAGYRLLDGFDISNKYALEAPDALLRAIRARLDDHGTRGEDVDVAIAEVRAKVPPAHRDEFDELVAEARIGYSVRDERGVYSDIWASGLMRRAALAAGRRAARRGRLHDAEHVVFARLDEMCALVRDEPAPSADELADRQAFHLRHTARAAPPFLGVPPQAPPDPSGLPPGAARIMRAVGTAMGTMFHPSEQAHDQDVLRGLSASAGSYEGIARRVHGARDFDRIQQGDVLVTEATTEAFNILLPLLGAIVTDSGGLLSHSAIVAREYGIPGVVGTRDATERIPDGARVRVDGDTGQVTVL
ncbi:MAG TPA: PEP-utilizing enzyme [Mycobacteriales bacterium]|nr:PEP-utilizing enzyme [Mycobacteriales bacterium]